MRHPIALRLPLLLLAVLVCCSCERNEYSLPGKIIRFQYAPNHIDGWDKLSFEAYNEWVDDRLVWSAYLGSTEGVDDVVLVWDDQQFVLAHLSDEDITDLEDRGVEFSYTASDDIEEVQYRSSGEYNPNIRIYITFLDGKVQRIALISRGYPDPASGDERIAPIHILLGTGESISIPTQEKTLIDTFGPCENEFRSSHH